MSHPVPQNPEDYDVIQHALSLFKVLTIEKARKPEPVRVEGLDYEIALAFFRGWASNFGDINDLPEDQAMIVWAQATHYAIDIRRKENELERKA